MAKICPQCRRSLRGQFTFRGLLWGILCFPCGLFCCFRRRRMHCSSCENEVVISTGSFPVLAHRYKDYRSSLWQFPSSTTSNTNINGNSQSEQRPLLQRQ
ncbi:hypothetical protein ACQ4LE_004297 [Meloidogyne hapla]